MPTVKRPSVTGPKEKNEKKVKRKGLGGLTPEKRKLLKQLIMQKAAEDMKKQQEMEAEEKRKTIDARVPKLEIDGLDKSSLDKKVRELYDSMVRLEEQKFEWETRLDRQSVEMSQLNIKVSSTKGLFVKPVLKKVAKADKKLTKFEQFEPPTKVQPDFRDHLKSTGQPKFSIDEKEVETAKKPEWSRDQLKSRESESDEKRNDSESEESEESE